MTVSELINKTEKTAFSFEVLPPLKGTGTSALFSTIDALKEFGPEYINITTHRSEYVYVEQPDGTYLRHFVRRRPGTVAVASAIMQKYDIKVVPHVVVSGMTREDIEYMLLDLQFLGIQDILILRGDKAKEEAARLIADAKAQIESEKASALREIRAEMAQLSVLVAEKVGRKNLSDDKAQMELIDKLLDEVSVDK